MTIFQITIFFIIAIIVTFFASYAVLWKNYKLDLPVIHGKLYNSDESLADAMNHFVLIEYDEDLN